MMTREGRTLAAETGNAAHADAGGSGSCSLWQPLRHATNQTLAVREVRLGLRYSAQRVALVLLSPSGSLQPVSPHFGTSHQQHRRRCTILASRPPQTAERWDFLRRWRQNVVRWHRMLQGRSGAGLEAAPCRNRYRVQIWVSFLKNVGADRLPSAAANGAA